MLNLPGCASGRHGCVAVRVKAEQGAGPRFEQGAGPLSTPVPFQNADDRPAVADGAPGARSRRRGQGRLLPPAHHPCAGDVVAGRCSSCCWCWNRTSSRARSSDEGGGCCGWERCRAAATWSAASPPSSRGEGGAAAAAAGAWVGGTAACGQAARVQRRAGLRTARIGTGAACARG